ncbi:MAG: hypothetical protein ACYC7E_22865 [Armatimonadota bacterium]
MTENHYLTAATGYLHPVYLSPTLLGGRVYLFGGVETGSAFDHLDTAKFTNDAFGGIIVFSPLGPIAVGATLDDDEQTKVYFSIGRLY